MSKLATLETIANVESVNPSVTAQPTPPSTGSLFDRKFVVTAVIIGAAYVGIVLIISAVLGKDGAKVAGVALAALLTGLFKKFESLRFQQLAESEYRTVAIPHLHWWAFVLATAWCFFLMSLFPAIILLPFLLRKMASHLNDPAQAFAQMGAEVVALSHSILANLLILCGILAANILFGATCALFSPRRAAYTYAIFGALLAQAIPPSIIAIMFLMAGKRPPFATPIPIGGEFVPLACIAVAFIGAYFASIWRERSAIKR